MTWQHRIRHALTQRQQSGTFRQRLANQQGNSRWLIHQHRRYLNFAGNDYLGLSRHPDIINAWCAAAHRYGTGSGGSGHITGYHIAHQQLEQALADWLGYPRAILFISGFAANQAVISCLMQQGDDIFADKLSHNSLIDAALSSPAQLRRFPHNRPDSLRQRLEKPANGCRLIVTEGVFSMDGDSAPLAQISALARQHQALLLVDDAHGIGVIGEQGRGSCALAGIKPDLLIVTFGKAFGLSGAAVLCNQDLADYFTQFARHLIYSTAMPPAQAVALHTALNLIQQGQPLRDTLQTHIRHFCQAITPHALAIPAPHAAAAHHNLTASPTRPHPPTAFPASIQPPASASHPLASSAAASHQATSLYDHPSKRTQSAASEPPAAARSHTAIQPLIIGDNARAVQIAQQLREQGIWINAILPPTVPPGTARLRITLSAAHHPEDIDRLLQALTHVTH